MFFAPGGNEAQLAVENVHAWIRSLNNEHMPWGEAAFRSSQAWIFGFKSEFGRVLFYAEDNTQLEVLGGSDSGFRDSQGAPLIISRDSKISLAFFTRGGSSRPSYETILLDETNGRVKELSYNRFPLLGGREYDILIPLLVNY